MKKNIDYVNVFQGSDTADLPKAEGLAATWLFLKPFCGNNHPGAAYPFGRMTVLSYTGGYPTGYGDHWPNTCGAPRLFDAKVQGFSHLHVNGTGRCRTYYNYAVTAPIPGDALGQIAEDMTEEIARPGYYSAKLSSGVRFEGTVSHALALHRYTFPESGLLQIDFSNCGLRPEFNEDPYIFQDEPTAAWVKIVSPHRVTAYAKMKGIDLYFAAECRDAAGVGLWQENEWVDGKALTPTLTAKFGAAFRVSGQAQMRMAVSFRSEKAALAQLDADNREFDAVLADTTVAWEGYLDKIQIETKDERLKEIFYSNFYHSLLKPCDAAGESFVYDTDGPFYYDIMTIWDMYKTLFPLIFSLYPEESRGIVETFLQQIEAMGCPRINLGLIKKEDFAHQARMLAEHVFADYYYRGGEGLAQRMLAATDRELACHKDFLETGYCERYTHILDICDALSAMAAIAREQGETQIAERYEALAKRWVNAYDPETGLMSENSKYYEGDFWNYSFRLQHDMDGRIALAGKERFVEYLDRFFGFTREPVVQSTEPEKDPTIPGFHSFEGFNNESDMEAPYAYVLSGHHDKACRVLRDGMAYMFSTGRGGLPGNADSGGLPSLYLWNAMGIFPVTGQDKMLIGSPVLDGAKLQLANGKTFTVKVYGNSPENILVDKAVLNGETLTDYCFTARQMMSGGTLELWMK